MHQLLEKNKAVISSGYKKLLYLIIAFAMDALISNVETGQELNSREIHNMADMLLDESVSVEKKARFLRGLTAKGETPSEIAGFVEAFLERAVDPGIDQLDLDGPTIDVCGTGGDKLNLFNVSTTSMFVIAAGGGVVVKHGNRGITSKSGGADVLEALGIKLDASPAQFRQCLQKAGVGFLFAPMYHPAFKAVAPVRKQLAEEGTRTIFNLIGPLLNPARPECQLVGICQKGLRASYAEILSRLGRDSAWVVHGHTVDGRSVDEVSVMGTTHISKAGAYQDLEDEEISPVDFGLPISSVEELEGGDAKVNAQILIDILSGEDQGAKRNMVVMNAAAGLTCAGLADHMEDGITMAASLIDSGEALKRLRLMQTVFT